MALRYMTDDGEVFENESEATEHDRSVGRRNELKEQVEKHCSMLDYANDRARARDVTIVMKWIDYDLKKRPWRYDSAFDVADAEVEEEVDEEAVRAITGTA